MTTAPPTADYPATATVQLTGSGWGLEKGTIVEAVLDTKSHEREEGREYYVSGRFTALRADNPNDMYGVAILPSVREADIPLPRVQTPSRRPLTGDTEFVRIPDWLNDLAAQVDAALEEQNR